MNKVTYDVTEVNRIAKTMVCLYSTNVRDIAETVMVKAFHKANSTRNFVVLDRATKKIIAYCFNEETKALGANWW